MKRTIPIAKPTLGRAEAEGVRAVLKSGMLAQGEKVRSFENAFAEYIAVKHAIATANGTLALDTALKALQLTSGDEVIVPAFSFIATGNCVLFQGSKPVFADINKKTFNIDPSDVNEKITGKTKAIIAVHLYGQPAEMEELSEIASDNRLFLIEDAAQAHGAEYKKQKAGSLGDVGCFSFYATKNITTGEGGMIVTNNDEVDRRARMLRSHGESTKYHHLTLGYNYRMTELAAAIGLVQLGRLDEINGKRIQNAEMLNEKINRIRGLTAPYVDKHMKHVFYQYVIRVEADYPLERDELASLLKDKGIGTAIHYPLPIYRQPLYRELGFSNASCPVTEDACKRVLSLPVHPSVTRSDIQYICDACVG